MLLLGWDHGRMEHRSSSYLSSRRIRHHRGLFRTAQLNIVGRAAVAGLCLAGAGIGFVSSRASGVPAWVAAPAGGAAALLGLVAADRRKWGTMETVYAWTEDATEVERVADLIERDGVAVRVDIDEQGQARLRYLNRDGRRIRRIFRRAGIPQPHTR
jgi:hypothetical protein